MNPSAFEDLASTNLEEWRQEASATSLPADTMRSLLRRSGTFFAGLVLGAALAGTGPASASLATELGRRKRHDNTAESSTTAPELDPALVREVRQLFEQGSSEFFHDGVHSNFSRRLLRTLASHREMALRAIAEYLFSGKATPDVASEALRWLADFNDSSTLTQRWAILQRSLKHRSPRVRDEAILGFGALDDPRARQLLLDAQKEEQVTELQKLIDQVVAQLDRVR